MKYARQRGAIAIRAVKELVGAEVQAARSRSPALHGRAPTDSSSDSSESEDVASDILYYVHRDA
eukprot:2740017-Amphidinium_carterae.1